MRDPERFSGLGRFDLWAFLGGLAVPGFLIAWLLLGRKYLIFGTETDFLGTFRPLAERLLRLEPAKLDAHPPGYAFAVALFYGLTRDWVGGAFLLSWLSALAAAGTSCLLFYRMFGRWAGAGALAALASSPSFIFFSASATSDVFFLAVYSAALLLCHEAFHARRPWMWLASGALLGLGVLARTNGLILLTALVLPWLGSAEGVSRPRRAALLAAGALLPVCGWLLWAFATGSTVLPTGISELFYGSFYPTADMVPSRRFDSVFHMLVSEPRHVMAVYLWNLYANVRVNLIGQGGYILGAFALPGLMLLGMRARSPFQRYYCFLTAAHLLLLGFGGTHPRYFLFLCPLFGAAAGLCIESLVRAVGPRPGWRRMAVPLALTGVFLLPYAVGGSFHELREIRHSLHLNDRELDEAIPAVKEHVPPGCRLFARKPHLPYYAGRRLRFFPMVETPAELLRNIGPYARRRCTYLYFGSAEFETRPELRGLIAPFRGLPWLEPVASSRRAGVWTLYQVLPE